MFNKILTKTQYDASVFPFLQESLNKSLLIGTNSSYVSYIEPYLRDYVYPKLARPRNISLLKEFLNDDYIAGCAFDRGLLVKTDLSYQILLKDENFNKILTPKAQEFICSDEAAWILMETTQSPFNNVHYNYSSVWFRSFSDEARNDPSFEKRLIQTVDSYLDRSLEGSFLEEEVRDVILSFHLYKRKRFTPNPRIDYLSLITNSFNSYYDVTKENMLWALIFGEPKKIGFVLSALVLYSDMFPKEIRKKYALEAHDKLKQTLGVRVEIFHCHLYQLRKFLSQENFQRMLKDFPQFTPDKNFVFRDSFFQGERNLLDNAISLYQNTEKEHLHKVNESILKKRLQRFLEKEFKTNIDVSSLEQLISIFRSVR